jgi:hypothetical protein
MGTRYREAGPHGRAWLVGSWWSVPVSGIVNFQILGFANAAPGKTMGRNSNAKNFSRADDLKAAQLG